MTFPPYYNITIEAIRAESEHLQVLAWGERSQSYHGTYKFSIWVSFQILNDQSTCRHEKDASNVQLRYANSFARAACIQNRLWSSVPEKWFRYWNCVKRTITKCHWNMLISKYTNILYVNLRNIKYTAIGHHEHNLLWNRMIQIPLRTYAVYICRFIMY